MRFVRPSASSTTRTACPSVQTSQFVASPAFPASSLCCRSVVGRCPPPGAAVSTQCTDHCRVDRQLGTSEQRQPVSKHFELLLSSTSGPTRSRLRTNTFVVNPPPASRQILAPSTPTRAQAARWWPQIQCGFALWVRDPVRFWQKSYPWRTLPPTRCPCVAVVDELVAAVLQTVHSVELFAGLVLGNRFVALDQPRHVTTSLSVREQWSGALATKALEKTPLQCCALSAVRCCHQLLMLGKKKKILHMHVSLHSGTTDDSSNLAFDNESLQVSPASAFTSQLPSCN